MRYSTSEILYKISNLPFKTLMITYQTFRLPYQTSGYIIKPLNALSKHRTYYQTSHNNQSINIQDTLSNLQSRIHYQIPKIIIKSPEYHIKPPGYTKYLIKPLGNLSNLQVTLSNLQENNVSNLWITYQISRISYI